MEKYMKKIIGKIILILSTIAMFGCAGVRPYTFDVRVDKVYKNASIEVNAIGVSSLEMPRFADMSISDYWKPNNEIRMSENPKKVKFQFPSDKPMVLSQDSSIWESWFERKAEYIVFIADLPGVFEDRQGNVDRRRLVLPLDSSCWDLDEYQPIVIEITPQGIISSPHAKLK